VTFGGQDTQRTGGLAKTLTAVFESLGVLNKGSAAAAAAPEPSEVDQVQAVSTNSLNVTRVGGLAAFIAGVGAAALAVFEVDKAHDHASVVVAAYVSVGVIVAGALLAAAIIVAADIRARGAIAVATSPSAVADLQDVTSVHGSANTKATLSRPYDYVLVDAGAGDVDLALPSPASCPWQSLTVKRTDGAAANYVRVEPFPGGPLEVTPAAREKRLYSDGNAWVLL
jgi:hypothetical protein